MTTALDLHDIQGNIVFGYGRYGYPKARYIFFKFNGGVTGREFVKQLADLITTSAPLDKQREGVDKPDSTTNIAFTYKGLQKLNIPDESLRSFPDEYRMGMKARAAILGDDQVSSPEHWDPIWQDESKQVHMWMSINGASETCVDERYNLVLEILDNVNSTSDQSKQVELLSGHRGAKGQDNLPYQSASAIYKDYEVGTGETKKTLSLPTNKEHFGYSDGISNPYFKGMSSNPEDCIGGGATTGKDPATEAGWKPIDTGEFVLGHRDETNEYPAAPVPRLLSYNGSFMVYRKLHENVGSFEEYTEKTGEKFDGGSEAVKAKFSGRWPNGAPMATYPTLADAEAFGNELEAAMFTLFINPETKDKENKEVRKKYEKLKLSMVAFDYEDTINGSKCPVGAHMRRTNPRGALEFGKDGAFNTPGALVDRRRILRRGLPYGDSSDRTSNKGDHGIIFIAINSNIERQFEFVQQQWINYGNDYKLSNTKDPILGNHKASESGCPMGRNIIDGDSETGRLPHMCANMPRFVETRGGDYFFIPSMTAIRMIGEGIIDPT